MKTKINVVSIPFASKKKLKWPSNSRKNIRSVEGIAYFIFDPHWKECIRQIPYLIAGEYRPNDSNMIKGKDGKGTCCWQEIGQERKKIFPTVSNNSQTETLTEEQIEKINEKALQEWKTILTLDKWLSGSNPSGSETAFKNTPYFTNISEHPKLSELVFINCFKTINNLIKNIDIEEFKSFDDLKKQAISFSEFWEKKCCQEFNSCFNIYNDGLIEPAIDRKDKKEEIKNNLSFWQKQKIEQQREALQNYEKKNEQNVWSFQNKKNKYSEKEKHKQCKILINKQRRIFIMSLKLEKQLEKMNLNSYIENDQIYEQSNLEGAHIYPVHEAVKNNEFEVIGDYQNGLLMSANLHKSYDNGIFYFNEEGGIILRQKNKNISKKNLKIKEQILTLKRKDYLKKYLKYWR